MSNETLLTPVWSDKNFRIHKGKLKARAQVSGQVLGHGLIYYVGRGTVQHVMSGQPTAKEYILAATSPKSRYLWNAGALTEIVNIGGETVHAFRVGPKYRKKELQRLPAYTLAAATELLVQGDWPEAFKASVEVDLKAIGALALAFSRGEMPTPAAIVCARQGQEDLESKLAWVVDRFKSAKKMLAIFGGGGGGGGRLGRTDKGVPFDPAVRVKVNTKDQDGTTDVKGCEVWWNLAGYGGDFKNAERFPRLSTPTTETLMVGRYTMWAQKAGVVGRRSPIEVGASRKDEQVVDVFAPET